MISTAKLRYLRIAPRKVRLVADLIRGEKVERAQFILSFTQKRAVLPITKLLKQAVVNAKNKDLRIDEKNLYISKILVDEGPRDKRNFPRSRGRADIIQKKTSHITIVLDEIKKEGGKKRIRKKKGQIPAQMAEKSKETKKPAGKEVSETKKEDKLTPERKKIKWRPERKKPKPERKRALRKLFRRKAI
jgi:large subunit ribosomal protein L22